MDYMFKKCLHCRSELKPKMKNGKLFTGGLPKKFCNHTCATRYASRKRYNKMKDDKDYTKKKSLTMIKWYNENKEKQKKNIKKNYYNNKDKWVERRWVNVHRKAILTIIPKECSQCNKKGIKVIHHKVYGKTPKLNHSRYAKEKNFETIKEYATKYLLGFCSKNCHRRHERK